MAHETKHTQAFLAWQAGNSLSTIRDLREELGLALGHIPPLRRQAVEARGTMHRRVYLTLACQLRERRDWLRCAIAKAGSAQ